MTTFLDVAIKNNKKLFQFYSKVRVYLHSDITHAECIKSTAFGIK